MIHYVEILRPENFASLVDAPSTKQRSSSTKNQFNQVTERVIFYQRNRIIGVQVRDVTGYRYFLRADKLNTKKEKNK